MHRNFKRVQTNHINVELNLFLKLLYPTFSAYSWETEELSLSPSPVIFGKGQDLSLICFSI